MATVNVTVARYNPLLDNVPVKSTYSVPWAEYMTVLQALHHINEYFEPLNFDFSCRGGLCGRCGVMVNGKPSLACFTIIEEGQDVEIEPLAGFPVIRDLVIDRTPIEVQLDLANAEVQLGGDIDLDDLPRNDYETWWQDLHRKNMCRECGLCFAVCPAYRKNKLDYAGPAALSQVYLRAYDGLDTSDRILQAVNLGVMNCALCGECNKVCPSYIDHVSCNKRLQDDARARGLVASEG